jgi:uncharacterized membrane protein YuzA (DUF378 family)
MKKLDLAAATLLFIGAVSWGFVGIFGINPIHLIVENTWGDRFIYSLIGAAAIYKAIYWKAIRSRWKED